MYDCPHRWLTPDSDVGVDGEQVLEHVEKVDNGPVDRNIYD